MEVFKSWQLFLWNYYWEFCFRFLLSSSIPVHPHLSHDLYFLSIILYIYSSNLLLYTYFKAVIICQCSLGQMEKRKGVVLREMYLCKHTQNPAFEQSLMHTQRVLRPLAQWCFEIKIPFISKYALFLLLSAEQKPLWASGWLEVIQFNIPGKEIALLHL